MKKYLTQSGSCNQSHINIKIIKEGEHILFICIVHVQYMVIQMLVLSSFQH